MPQVNLGFEFQVEGGPGQKASAGMRLDTYHLSEITIPAGTENNGVITPGTASAQVGSAGAQNNARFLAITASRYTEDLSYHVKPPPNAPVGAEYKMDMPLMVAGAGPSSRIALASETLLFANKTKESISILIVAGNLVP